MFYILSSVLIGWMDLIIYKYTNVRGDSLALIVQ